MASMDLRTVMIAGLISYDSKFNRDDCLITWGTVISIHWTVLYHGILRFNHSHFICQTYFRRPFKEHRKYGNWMNRRGSLTAFESPSYAVWKTFLGVDRNASAPITMAERWQRTLSEICLGLTAYRMSSRSHKCIYFIGCDGASAPRRTGDEEGLSSQLSIKNTPGQKYTWINHKPHRLGSTLLQRSNTIVFQAKTTPISSYTCIINIIWNKKD